MNQKKCPKCGENNPAEAVMCWACYTPLSGGAAGLGAAAAAPAGMAPKAGGKAAKDDGDGSGKKPIEKWQIAVIGVALLFAVGFGLKTVMGGSSTDDVPTGGGESDKKDEPPKAASAPAPAPVGPSGPAPNAPGGGGVTPDSNVPFIVICAPNPKIKDTATMAIMPRQPPVNSAKAAGLAAFARRQFLNVNNWDQLFIFVFNDSNSAQTFRDYQAKRQQRPLTAEDYSALSSIWPNTPARYWYKTASRSESVVDPSQVPYFWTGRK